MSKPTGLEGEFEVTMKVRVRAADMAIATACVQHAVHLSSNLSDPNSPSGWINMRDGGAPYQYTGVEVVEARKLNGN